MSRIVLKLGDKVIAELKPAVFIPSTNITNIKNKRTFFDEIGVPALIDLDRKLQDVWEHYIFSKLNPEE
jgi:hypothetical protein